MPKVLFPEDDIFSSVHVTDGTSKCRLLTVNPEKDVCAA